MRIKWTYERCKKEALKYESRSAWKKCSGSSYSASYRRGWIDSCTAHMKNAGITRIVWTLKLCKEKALEYPTRTSWKKGHRSSYSAAQRLGVLDECTKHMIRPYNTRDEYWTFERCKEKALEYQVRTSWRQHHAFSYQIALKNGWIEECCAHMINNVKTDPRLFAMSASWKL